MKMRGLSTQQHPDLPADLAQVWFGPCVLCRVHSLPISKPPSLLREPEGSRGLRSGCQGAGDQLASGQPSGNPLTLLQFSPLHQLPKVVLSMK